MSEADIEEFKQKLLRLRTGLQKLEESSKEATEAVEPDQAALGRLSRREAMQAQLSAEEGARQRKRQLEKIEGAFRRIEAGEYGNCFICGEKIEMQRLSADPTYTRCTKCIEG